ncbi:hypothetical protein COCON_G00220050 [Conger conger]|uniref:Uncharacterized protein n=1 Tax=Conger conger TaxID=82655 RepID=A0A9Q1HPS3_CONCO|nr:hypothetical protein COCON_G00220050 [Conger conger]
MDILQESTLLPAQVNSVKAQDPEWKVCRTPDRKYADALLSISEDTCAKDEDAYEASFESGWEEAVQGWAAYPSAVEHRSFKLALCADGASPDAGRLALVETFPDPAGAHALDKRCAERGRDVTAIINSFSVLPPVKAEGAGDPGSPALTKTTSGAALNQSAAHRVSEGGGSQDVLGARGQAGVEKICELIKQAGVESGVPEARCGPFPRTITGCPACTGHLRTANTCRCASPSASRTRGTEIPR